MILDLESVFNTEGLVKGFDFELDLSQEELSGVKPLQHPFGSAVALATIPAWSS